MAASIIQESAAFWEGWQAYRTKMQCTYQDGYQDGQNRTDWADGFKLAYNEDISGKVWWKSKTLWVGALLGIVGVVLWRFGGSIGGTTGGQVYAGAGGGLSASAVLMMLLRFVTKESVSFTSP